MHMLYSVTEGPETMPRPPMGETRSEVKSEESGRDIFHRNNFLPLRKTITRLASHIKSQNSTRQTAQSNAQLLTYNQHCKTALQCLANVAAMTNPVRCALCAELNKAPTRQISSTQSTLHCLRVRLRCSLAPELSLISKFVIVFGSFSQLPGAWSTPTPKRPSSTPLFLLSNFEL